MPIPSWTVIVNSDGTINIVDALMTAQHYVGLNPPDFDPTNADTGCNGTIDIIDALLIAQYYVGLISEFCCEYHSEWIQIETNLHSITENYFFSYISFVKADFGWIQAGEEVFRSLNGGEVWERIPLECTYSDDGFSIQTIFFVDKEHGWILHEDTLYTTENGGNQWTVQPLPDASCRRIYFTGVSNGVACTHYDFYYTEDGGKTWKQSIVNNIDNGWVITHLYFTDQARGFATAWGPDIDSGTIFTTTDGGKSWSSLRFAYEYQAIYSTDGMHIIAAGINGLYRCGIIETTFDGGITWHYTLAEPFIDYVSFLDPNYGVAVTNSKLLFETYDGGKMWQKIEIIGDESSVSVSVVENTMYILTINGKIYRYMKERPQ